MIAVFGIKDAGLFEKIGSEVERFFASSRIIDCTVGTHGQIFKGNTKRPTFTIIVRL